MKQRIITLFCICLLLFLLVHPEEALLSAKDGMSLWLNVMIPTLLPFLILTGILLKTGNIPQLLEPLAPFWKHFFGISPAGAYVLILGFLCGYPMGAKAVVDMKSGGHIGKEQAEALLILCNNPVFLSMLFTTASINTRIYRIVTFLQTSLRFIFQNLELFYGFNKLYSQLPDIV